MQRTVGFFLRTGTRCSGKFPFFSLVFPKNQGDGILPCGNGQAGKNTFSPPAVPAAGPETRGRLPVTPAFSGRQFRRGSSGPFPPRPALLSRPPEPPSGSFRKHALSPVLLPAAPSASGGPFRTSALLADFPVSSVSPRKPGPDAARWHEKAPGGFFPPGAAAPFFFLRHSSPSKRVSPIFRRYCRYCALTSCTLSRETISVTPSL